MSKRIIGLASFTLILLFSLCTVASAQVYSVPESPSVVFNFNLDWKFLKPSANTWPLQTAANGVVDAQGWHFYEPDYDDSAWEDVCLPHTFNNVDSFRNVANDAGDVGVWRGIVFYRKTFFLPESYAKKKVFIEFEGIRQAAYVYLNGVMVVN